MRNIKNMEILLQNIAAGLNKLKQHKICNLEVVFYKDKEIVLNTDVQTALDYLANDVYWNAENNWTDANTAKVRTF